MRQDFEGATSGQLKIYEGQVVSVIGKLTKFKHIAAGLI